MTYVAEVLADAPDVYYRLDDSGTTFVDFANGHNAAASGTIISAGSLLGSDPDAASAFDPATTNNKATTSPLYTIAQQPMSIEFWVKPGSLTGSGGAGASSLAACLNAATNQGWEVAYVDTTGVYRLLLCNVAFYNFSSAVKAQIGVTQHIVYALTTTTVELYVNGSSQGQLATGTMIGGANALTFAGSGASGNNGRPTAVMDEIAFYKTLLPANRVLAHYQAGITPPQARQVGSWMTSQAHGG